MKTPKHLLLIVGTAWLFDAMDVALLSFIMPLLKTEWSLTGTQLGSWAP
jgi:putative MFS transporter